MAYLLHPTSFAAPAAPGSEADSGASTGRSASLLRPVRTLMQGLHAALHGEPLRTGPPRSVAATSGRATVPATLGGDDGSSSNGSRRSGDLSSRFTQQPTLLAPASSRGSGTAQPVPSSVFSTSPAHRPAAACTPPPSPTAKKATTSSCSSMGVSTSVPSSAASALSSATAAPALPSDAELFARAVNYEDVEEVLRCPLPPVAGCPTPFAFGGHMSGEPTAHSTHTAAASKENGSPAPSASNASSPLVFRCIAADRDTGITIYSTPVEECPMHLMRAYAILPCPPREVLQYMDNDVRPQWDGYIRRSAMLRELPPPPPPNQDATAAFPLTHSLGTAQGVAGYRSPTSLSATARTHAAAAVPVSSSSCCVAPAPFAYRPGQRRVAIHYLETRSPVPFVQDRDFELVVAEEVREDGTAFSKAFSTPLGYHMPLDPQQSRYVRAVVLLSGLVARPLDAAAAEATLPPILRRHRAALLKRQSAHQSGGKANKSTAAQRQQPPQQQQQRREQPSLPTEYCVLEYIGLVHPMGMLPAVLVNVVISAQLNAMRKMQAFIAGHPMATLRPPQLPPAFARGSDGLPLRPTVPAIKELSAALRASPSAAAEGRREEGVQPPPSLPSTPLLSTASDGMDATAGKEGKDDEAVPSPANKGERKTKDSPDGPAAGKGTEGSAADGKDLTTDKQSRAKPWWRWRPSRLLSRL